MHPQLDPRESEAEARGHDPEVMRVDGMGDPPPLLVREPRQYARPRWAEGKTGKRGATSEWPSMADMCNEKCACSQSNVAFQGIEVDTNAGTGQKSWGRHCQQILKIRAASMRAA